MSTSCAMFCWCFAQVVGAKFVLWRGSCLILLLRDVMSIMLSMTNLATAQKAPEKRAKARAGPPYCIALSNHLVQTVSGLLSRQVSAQMSRRVSRCLSAQVSRRLSAQVSRHLVSSCFIAVRTSVREPVGQTAFGSAGIFFPPKVSVMRGVRYTECPLYRKCTVVGVGIAVTVVR